MIPMSTSSYIGVFSVKKLCLCFILFNYFNKRREVAYKFSKLSLEVFEKCGGPVSPFNCFTLYMASSALHLELSVSCWWVEEVGFYCVIKFGQSVAKWQKINKWINK